MDLQTDLGLIDLYGGSSPATKYWLLDGRALRGPWEAGALVRASGFDRNALVCPEGKSLGYRRNWRQAGKCADIKAALPPRGEAASRPQEPDLAWTAAALASAPEESRSRRFWAAFRRPRAASWGIPLGAAAAAVLATLWMAMGGGAMAGKKPAAPLAAVAAATAAPRAAAVSAEDLSFDELRAILNGLAEDPAVAPLVAEVAAGFSAEPKLWGHYLAFENASRRGERRRAVDFVGPLLMTREFRRLDGLLSRRPEAVAAIQALARTPELEPFWKQWRREWSSAEGLSSAPTLAAGLAPRYLLSSLLVLAVS